MNNGLFILLVQIRPMSKVREKINVTGLSQKANKIRAKRNLD